MLDELGQAMTSVADRAAASVVRVGGGWRGGSGVVIGDGIVLTNAHNVRGDGAVVLFADGRRAEAELKGVDIDGDLAVLAVDTSGAPALSWSSASLSIGTPIFAVAAADGGARVTFGFVSSVARAFRGPRGRRISGSLEHTAALAPGSSGSALVDGEGRLVGLNTNRLGGGFYLALPADEALRNHVAALGRGESAERPRLGIGIAPNWVATRMRRAVGLPEHDGVLVREVEDGSAAAAAGLQEGDLLIEAAGKPIREPDDVYDALGTVQAGGKLSVRIVRGADERSVEVDFNASSGETSGDSSGPVH
ncbi:MAG TPA: trypsin-like peptidase domain-containing protein [Candidatus Limnocylindria bacterium]|nr:trypsin-like peptidase domain-containing protein [Candidatus Limnocylindria bacterium]